MLQLAFYGKGGIGKSTTVSNLAVVWAARGHRVLQVGCDPKADSTLYLRHGEDLTSVMDLVRSGQPLDLADLVTEGFGGVLCAEAGGPLPGRGCAGRGIITALETLDEKGVLEAYRPDLVLYDVLGDVVCGGFALPMRQGYAQEVFVLTSGENMSLHAAANIGLAVQHYQERGYARLGGLVLNRRDVRDEEAKVTELAGDLGCRLVGDLPRDRVVTDAEEAGMTLMEFAPQSPQADAYRALADAIEAVCAADGMGQEPGAGDGWGFGQAAASQGLPDQAACPSAGQGGDQTCCPA